MPPPKGFPNPLEGPGDYDLTSMVHSDTYASIDPSKSNLTGKAVFVCGASKGIGKAIALSFAKAGASKIAIGARSNLSDVQTALKEVALAAGRPEPHILSIQLDLTEAKSVENAAEEIEKEFGRLDIVINNAGLLSASSIVDSDPEDWWRVWKVNLGGPYLVARSFIPLMKKGGDKTIVTVSSVGAHLQGAGLSAYQTSKMAVVRLSEFIGSEHGHEGFVAYSIHPGNVKTDMTAGFDSPELAPIFVDTPELCGDSLVYLCSRKRDWLSGRYVNVTWDLPELLLKEDEIVKGDKLKIRMVI